MLHDTRDKDILAVTDSVYLKLSAHKILVYKYRVLYSLVENDSHVFLDIIIIECDYHVLSAENVRRSHKNRIMYLICNFESLVTSHDRKALRSLYLKLFKQFVKSLSVLSSVNSVRRSTKNVYTMFSHVLCELDSSLSAECHNNSNRLFNSDDVHNILVSKRLEIKSVSSIKVS